MVGIEVICHGLGEIAWVFCVSYSFWIAKSLYHRGLSSQGPFWPIGGLVVSDLCFGGIFQSPIKSFKIPRLSDFLFH